MSSREDIEKLILIHNDNLKNSKNSKPPLGKAARPM